MSGQPLQVLRQRVHRAPVSQRRKPRERVERHPHVVSLIQIWLKFSRYVYIFITQNQPYLREFLKKTYLREKLKGF
jgi:hypothetical protein